MNRIKVITKKIPLITVSTAKYLNFSNDLTYMAKTFDGFIRSKYYNDYVFKNNEIIFYNISDWNNIESWLNWVNSKERCQIITKNNLG